MSARVYFMQTVNVCKNMSIMSPQNKQCVYTVIFLFYEVQPYAVKTYKQSKCEHSR